MQIPNTESRIVALIAVAHDIVSEALRYKQLNENPSDPEVIAAWMTDTFNVVMESLVSGKPFGAPKE